MDNALLTLKLQRALAQIQVLERTVKLMSTEMGDMRYQTTLLKAELAEKETEITQLKKSNKTLSKVKKTEETHESDIS